MKIHVEKSHSILKTLATYYNADVDKVEKALSNEKATTYLVVWSVFEQSISNGFMKLNDIKDIAQIYSANYILLNVDSVTKKFHKRYQDKKKFSNLIHSQSNSNMTEILNKQFSDLKDSEKMELLLFVVYRYRNNIFHGNKGVLSWQHYTEQIDDCLAFMTKMIDVVNRTRPQ